MVALEGPDGAGKSTQAALLAEALRRRGREVVSVREPGGTALGERVRAILLDPAMVFGARSELLLFMAARAQLCDEVVAPALGAGRWVVSDRFLLSSYAYQGAGARLGGEVVASVAAVATGGLGPDLTLVLDVPPELGLSRRAVRPDRLESRPLDYHHRVREAFLAGVRALGGAAAVVDGTASEEAVAREVLRRVTDALG
ncbi:MAG: dTMP kinase [Planctomycetes bacterium]|nr:dTMP kinase [Planctomycetota bacterium]